MLRPRPRRRAGSNAPSSRGAQDTPRGGRSGHFPNPFPRSAPHLQAAGASGRAGPGRKCRAGPAPLLPGRPRRRPLQAVREARTPLLRPRTHLAAGTTDRLRARPTHPDARRRRPAADTAQPASHSWGRPTEVTSTLTHLSTQAQAPTAWWTQIHLGHTPQNTDSRLHKLEDTAHQMDAHSHTNELKAQTHLGMQAMCVSITSHITKGPQHSVHTALIPSPDRHLVTLPTYLPILF